MGGALIYNKLYGAKSYDKIETIMADAAREYLKDRNLKAPNNINDTITLTDKTLIKANKMKDISFYLKDKSIVCSREVKVTNINGDLEKTKILTDQYIGLLPINDFLNASLDTNCTNTTNKSCFNYNYLNKYKYTWWSVTANSQNTYQAYIIKDIVGTAQTNSHHYVRPVFYLATDTIYVSGNGTAKNPYVIK